MRFPTILLALIALAVPTTAAAAPRVLPATDTDLTAATAVKRTCGARLLSAGARGIDRESWKAPMSGFVNVSLSGARKADWDLAVFDAASGRRMGSSQAFGSTELVQTWVTSGQRLAIQGCRRYGSRQAQLEVQLVDLAPPQQVGTPSLVRVKLENDAALHALEELGLDVTHNIRAGAADVVLNGAADRALLEKHGFAFTTRIADLAHAYDQSRAADVAYARRLSGRSNLPSGSRASYRELADYELELKQLAESFPGHVKPVVLPKQTIEGRTIEGVEIAANVNRPEDGRPVYFVVGMHHAREWPAAEVPMEFAHMLAKGFGDDPRITSLLEKVRVVIVPILNKDGFQASREAGKSYSPRDRCSEIAGYENCNDLETVEGVPLGGNAAYRRKNCRGIVFPVGVPCELQNGVDPNRNYGEGWGGIGASMQPYAQTYRGTGPWSEPETQALHEYTRSRQVTNLITLHNVAALVLRPPGRHADGLAPDEPRMKELGNAMADATGYTSQYGWQLYDTSGGTEDWNYAAAGTFGYTIEIGPEDGFFHMPYQQGVVDEWNGTGAREGQGMREALMLSLESAANPSDHSVITGTAPAGRVLRIKKEFQTLTSPVCRVALDEPFVDQCQAQGDRIAVDDFIETTMKVPASGRFEWHVTPSTRPFIGWRRDPGEVASRRTDTFGPDGDEPTIPRAILENTEETEDDSLDQSSYFREFTVTPEDDARSLLVELTAPGNAEDYDLRLYRKLADGSLDPVGNGVGGYLPPEIPVFGGTQIFNGSPGSSGNPPGFAEAVEVLDPPVGTYVARVVNYSASGQTWTLTARRLYRKPDVFTDLGKREAWTVSCESADGKTVYEKQSIQIERGQSKSIDFGCGAERATNPPAANPPAGGTSKAAKIRRAKQARAACLRKARKRTNAKRRRAAKRACVRTYNRRVRRIRSGS